MRTMAKPSFRTDASHSTTTYSSSKCYTTMITRAVPALITLLLLCRPLTTEAAIGPDGLCALYLFQPFTNNGTATTSSSVRKMTNPAFTFLAAALLAAQHFNDRDPSVVPELSQLKEGNCNVRFDLDRSFAFDTGTLTHDASKFYLDQVSRTGQQPCAIVGPFSDIPAMELSVMATAARVPLVVVRSNNERVVLDEFSPFTSQVWPDLYEKARITAEFLLQRDRTDFCSLLYTVSDNNIQRREIIASQLESYGITWEAQPVVVRDAGYTKEGARTPLGSLQLIKDRGFRTIVVCMDNPLTEFPAIAEAADALGMNNGDYFWLWFGVVDPSFVLSDKPAYRKILHGSGLILPLEMFWLGLPSDVPEEDVDPFLKAWAGVDQDFIDRLNAINPVSEGDVGYVFADKSLFETQMPDWGAGYMYDAVISVGMGACAAASQTNASVSVSEFGSLSEDTTAATSGLAHLQGIRRSSFQGSTGRVEFINDGIRSGARLPSTMTYYGSNLVPGLRNKVAPGEKFNPYGMSDIWFAGSDRWTPLNPFIYADGRTVPPEFLRDPPDQNYISAGLQAFGIALCSLVWVAGIANIIWVYRHRKHRVMTASQPFFLCTMTVGCIVQASTIFVSSFDESDGWSQAALSTACAIKPWTITIGFILIYGSLFAKLWRVQRVMQFAHRKVVLKQVVWPTLVLISAAFLVLTVWSAVDSMVWERTELNEFTGASMGYCGGEHATAFIAALLVLMLIPILLTGYMAWKTKDVSDEFCEARWIWILIVIQLEVLMVAVPTIVILRDVSSDGRYLGMTFILFVFPMSALAVIMVPKMLHYYRVINGRQEIKPKRGEEIGSGRVRVSGLENSSPVASYTSRCSDKSLSEASERRKKLSSLSGFLSSLNDISSEQCDPIAEEKTAVEATSSHDNGDGVEFADAPGKGASVPDGSS